MMGVTSDLQLLWMFLWMISLHAGTFSYAVPLNAYKSTDSVPSVFINFKEFDGFPTRINIAQKDLNKSVDFAIGVVERMQRLEMSLSWSNIHVQQGSPSHGQLIDSKPEVQALRQGRNALVAAKATLNLLNAHCNRILETDYWPFLPITNWYALNHKRCSKLVSEYSLLHTSLHSACQNGRTRCTREQFTSKYRSVDGSCNNFNDGLQGKSYTGYKRILPANYADRVQQFRRSAVKTFDLPSPRAISTNVFNHENIVDAEITVNVMQWSQFVQHDLAHTATNKMVYSNNTIACCNNDGGHLLPRYVHPFCASIHVPEDDIFYSKHNVKCMPYVRSIAAMRPDCTFGPIDQINQATHFLDGSQIYGSDIEKLMQLRKFHKGLLKTSNTNHKGVLPVSSDTIDCQYDKPNSNCYISGDSRVNEQPQLTVMHVVWHREHNRLAAELSRLNPTWDDETLYQEARRIVVAEVQHITYNEWLPILLGNKYMSKMNEIITYSPEVDPRVANSFATAAVRAINSLIDDKVRLYQENRSVVMSLNLREHFNKPNILTELGHLDALIRGLATQPSQKYDRNYVQDITSQLYRSADYGFDILSLDIQRGRDHGLPSYTEARSWCGLSKVDDFADLSDVMILENVESLKSTYLHPKDIDLLVGGIFESSDGDSMFGPTLSCIIADQMMRTRRGDRYFYTSTSNPSPLPKAQLAEIGKVTLARIFCDNSDDVQFMQPNVFKKIGKGNDLHSCRSEEIPSMNLNHWKGTNK